MKSSVRQTAVCWRSAGLGRGCASVFWEHYSIKQSLNMHLHVSLHSRTQDTESGILNHFYLSVSSFCTYSVMVVIRTLPYLQCCFFLYSVRMTELNFLERQGSLWHWGLLAKAFKNKTSQDISELIWETKTLSCSIMFYFRCPFFLKFYWLSGTKNKQRHSEIKADPWSYYAQFIHIK